MNFKTLITVLSIASLGMVPLMAQGPNERPPMQQHQKRGFKHFMDPELKKLIDDYKKDKSEAVKAKIMEKLSKQYDSRIADMEKRLQEQKKNKTENIQKQFNRMTSDKPHDGKGKGGKRPPKPMND